MADLSVNICGVEFKNPVIPASGVFGYGREYEEFYPLSRLGGIATKGTTGTKRTGNIAPRIAETPAGMLNSVGLQNPGIDAFIANELPNLLTKDTVILANIAGSTPDECAEVAAKLDPTDVHMIELNISCPNVKQGRPQGNEKAAGGQALPERDEHHGHRQGSGSSGRGRGLAHQYAAGHAHRHQNAPTHSA